MSVWVQLIGSGEGKLWISRVPCIGERVVVNGLPRMVRDVEHQPMPWPISFIDGSWTAVTNPATMQACAAVVRVEDE